MADNATLYSVSQLNREAKRLLASYFLTVRVEGEISNFSAPSSGHCYFTLKDAQAQIRCALFKGQRQGLRFRPRDGDLVVVSAQVSLYEPRGDYQLIVEHMEQAGDGLLRQSFERLKIKLSNEGLFDESRKRAMPLIPAAIGVITSPTGAAIHDILTVLRRRFPAIPVIVYPVSVQGEAAKFEISRAIQTANERRDADVLILARGGGSLEDLQAFNDEIVARAIVASSLPVISGVGHEVDVTIADFVADLRAATPSAAAERAVPIQSDWLARFRQAEAQLMQAFGRQRHGLDQRLIWLSRALTLQHPGQKLRRNAQRLDELEQRLTHTMARRQQGLRARVAIVYRKLMQHQPTHHIRRSKQQTGYLEKRLQQAIRQRLATLKQRHTSLGQTLQAVSPLATLDRGYAIVLQGDGCIVKSTQQLQAGERIESRLAKGRIVSTVTQLID
ncbi:MAG: exodeoxyribonuclease VII large subunit [Methylomonas sp.]|nr:exodeoxyribonuclease VII large subunit [Methylomonas sp.]PPD21345.1 MAG: exodeoxyribonuclease VII large subunit [Methylomonas sp.]PPD26914.1 MAG: exodeoxyribonuclease VII large subunit [Methylomonas sp.]PPD38844.1 MAG: exodeoxyribonuclease VII large subunit [Methylomonas sp.]PPD41722.1 MAG: exodeoxyribonuclease VII large subunit [Methylomonas sp.]